MNFADVDPQLSSATLQGVESLGLKVMTPVQAACLPLFLKHKDVLVQAPTGSGKTIAFVLPIFEMLTRNNINYKFLF